MNLNIDSNQLNFLCKYTTGSNLYGTNIINSDIDLFGVYIDKINNIGSFITLIIKDYKNESIDEKFYELRNFISLIKNGDFYKLESLFLDKHIFSIYNKWYLIQDNKYLFLDSKAIFKWGITYCEQELKWANNPERFNNEISPQIQERFNKYGFDPACYGHAIMAAYKITYFFNTNYYLTKPPIYIIDLIKNIKMNPQKFNKKYLNELTLEFIIKMKESFSKRKNDYSFNKEKVMDLLNIFYLPS